MRWPAFERLRGAFGRRAPSRDQLWPDAPRGPDWRQARPESIDGALAAARSKPGGAWFVLQASRAVSRRPTRYVVAGQELVVWRDEGGTHCAPDACPHMGASLADGDVIGGKLVCPWHGLGLDARGFGQWQCLPLHDDGVLLWVRLDHTGETPSVRPVLPQRPERFVEAVVQMEGACEPQDIIANRLDPWHGNHFHPYAFRDLVVLEATDDRLTLRVSYRVAGPLGVEVDATFHCPDPRTIVMTIIGGEGAGSVVETHATPVSPGRSRIIEATLATSDRPGFQLAARAAPLLRPFMRAAAARLWKDDIAYAERRYALRTRHDGQQGAEQPPRTGQQAAPRNGEERLAPDAVNS